MWPRNAKSLPAALLLGAALSASGQESLKPDLDIPADSRAIPVLRRLQARSGKPLPNQAFPQRESGIAAFDSAATAADRFRLDYEFASRRSAPVAWSDSARGHSFFLSPFAEAGWQSINQSDSDDTRLLTGVGMRVYGKLFSRLSYYGRGAVYTEATDRPQFTHQFNPDYGETYSVEKGAGDSLLADRTYNRYEHYILLDLPWVTLKAGRDHVHMGPGYFSSLMATRDTPPYYQIEARVDFAPWLSVDDYLLRMTETTHDILKYANLHRFEFKPGHGLTLAFQDIVIYQDRDPDWRYALPLTPLAFSEDNTGGGDNDAMGFDFQYCGLKNLSVWGELFIDDLLGPTTFFNGFWQNRWAGLAGMQIVSPFPAVDADLVLEYSHVEPWTYTGASSQTNFKHFDVPSASKLGPDSRSVDAQLSYRPLPWMELAGHWELNEKGTGREAQLGQDHRDGIDPETKSFLSGDVDSWQVATQSAELLWRRWLRASAFWSLGYGDKRFTRFGVQAEARW